MLHVIRFVVQNVGAIQLLRLVDVRREQGDADASRSMTDPTVTGIDRSSPLCASSLLSSFCSEPSE